MSTVVVLLVGECNLLLAVVDALMGSMLLTGLFTLALIVPSLSITARRLHDTGRSGWWQLITLVPLIGVSVLLVFLVQDSTEGENAFGVSPKYLRSHTY